MNNRGWVVYGHGEDDNGDAEDEGNKAEKRNDDEGCAEYPGFGG